MVVRFRGQSSVKVMALQIQCLPRGASGLFDLEEIETTSAIRIAVELDLDQMEESF